MCGPKFCSMKITQEVRDFAAKQNSGVDSFLAATPAQEGDAARAHFANADASVEEVEQGMERMSREFKDTGGQLYRDARWLELD
jgi:phosphomethylpyrimidine synthase